MIETVPDVIFKLDLQGNLSWWNKRLAIITSFSPQELTGKPALAFVPEHEDAKKPPLFGWRSRRDMPNLRDIC